MSLWLKWFLLPNGDSNHCGNGESWQKISAELFNYFYLASKLQNSLVFSPDCLSKTKQKAVVSFVFEIVKAKLKRRIKEINFKEYLGENSREKEELWRNRGRYLN